MDVKLNTFTPLSGFVDLVTAAQKRAGIELGDDMTQFLVFALWRKIKTKTGDDRNPIFTQSLAGYVLKEQPKIPDVIAFINLGDSALVLAGLMPRFGVQRIGTALWYVDQGIAAYRMLGTMKRSKIGAVGKACDWLQASQRFPDLVDVLLAMPEESPLDVYTANSLSGISQMARRYLEQRNVISLTSRLQ